MELRVEKTAALFLMAEVSLASPCCCRSEWVVSIAVAGDLHVGIATHYLKRVGVLFGQR